MLNFIWLGLMLAAVIIGCYEHTLPAVVLAVTNSAKTAVGIALGLVGVMALWLGLMRVAEDAGIIRVISRLIKPIMRRLFPDVPAEHPAMSAMVLNISANMIGLGNAATPFGLRAMEQLEKLNPRPGVATDAMCMFLAINTSSVQIIPATAIAILSANGAHNPTCIIVPALIATLCSSIAGISAAKFFSRFNFFQQSALKESL